MKLKNKKTGEIADFQEITMFKQPTGNWAGSYNKLSKLNERWEDYEEPKEYFYIYADGDIYKDVQDDLRKDNGCKEIGNYFETKEEAEKAVEKLKAWKRLKDKGFRFKFTHAVGALDVEPNKFQIEITADMSAKWFCCDAVHKDLDLLFGGNDESSN